MEHIPKTTPKKRCSILMKKSHLQAIAVLLILSCIAAIIHTHLKSITKQKEINTYLIPFCNSIKGVIGNLDYIVSNPAGDLDASFSGVSVYFEMTLQSLVGLKSFYGYNDYEITNIDTKMKNIRSYYANMSDKYRSGTTLHHEDIEYLSLMHNSFNTLLKVIQKEDGSIRKEAWKKDLFSDKIEDLFTVLLTN